MRYFVMEQLVHSIPPPPAGDQIAVCAVSDLTALRDVDYSANYRLISNRLKELLELYLPLYDFIPVVYLDCEKKEQEVLWRFNPPVYEDCKASYRSDGVVSHILYAECKAPVFTALAPIGKRSVVMELSVAESILRRSMFGLKLTRLYGNE